MLNHHHPIRTARVVIAATIDAAAEVYEEVAALFRDCAAALDPGEWDDDDYTQAAAIIQRADRTPQPQEAGQ